MPLTFERFKVWEVVVPVRADILVAHDTGHSVYSGNTSWPELSIFLVEAQTSDGLTAVGEAGRGETRANVENTLRGLLGVDLSTTSASTLWMEEQAGLARLYPAWSLSMARGRSYHLLETLWHDAVGKAAGLPAHVLFGGAVRRSVAVDYWANRPNAEQLLPLVEEAASLGFSGIKLKCDAGGDTVDAVCTVSEKAPTGFRFTIDPMCEWRSLYRSRRFFARLCELPQYVQVEDPFPFMSVEDWHRARDQFPMTVICHCRDEATLQWALRHDVADALNLGGYATDFVRFATAAAILNKDCWQGSSLELGVGQHTRLHAASVAPNCLLSCDLQSEWVREHTLVTPRMQYANGCALVPDRPGLGIDLDHDAIKRYVKSDFEMV